MNERNTRQHWLPVSYLLQFAAGNSRKRTSPVWMLRHDGTYRTVPCESQGADNEFYTATRKADEQQFFREVDSVLPRIARLLSGGVGLNTHDTKALLSAMMVMHVRNPGLSRARSGERLDHLNDLLRIVYGQIIAGLPPGATDDEIDAGLEEAFRERWILHTFCAPEPAFVTSDNPSIWFQHANGGHFLGMPLTPHIWVILADTKKLAIRAPNDISDLMALNRAQAFNALGAIYSSRELSDASRAAFLEEFGMAHRDSSFYTEDGAFLRSIGSAPLGFIDAAE